MLKKFNDIETIIAGDLTRLKEVLHPENSGVVLPYSLAFASLEVGQSSLPHRLAGTEVYFFLCGYGQATIDGSQYQVEQNDTLLVPAGAIQSLENTGNNNLEFLCIVSPPWSQSGEEIIMDAAS
ncbi:MAG: cupin domain-containing protein [Saprospiraceae bacterium]